MLLSAGRERGTIVAQVAGDPETVGGRAIDRHYGARDSLESIAVIVAFLAQGV